MRNGIEYPVFRYCKEENKLNPIVSLPDPLILGLHALGELAKNPDKCLSTQQIAAAIGSTEPHLSKVLQRLNKGKWSSPCAVPAAAINSIVSDETPFATYLSFLAAPLTLRAADLTAAKTKFALSAQ